MEARSTPALPKLLIPAKNNVQIFFDMTAFSWKSPFDQSIKTLDKTWKQLRSSQQKRVTI